MRGTLTKNDTGRWEIVSFHPFEKTRETHELNAGDICEVQVDKYWIRTRIEHDGVDYYPTVAGIKLYEGMPIQHEG